MKVRIDVTGKPLITRENRFNTIHYIHESIAYNIYYYRTHLYVHLNNNSLQNENRLRCLLRE